MHYALLLGESELLYEGVKEVLTGTVSSPLAAAARETASCLLSFYGRPNYNNEFCIFAIKLVTKLL